MNTVKCLTENHYYVTDENFKVGLGKEESPKTQLGLLFEIIQSEDLGIEKADLDYEVSVVASIILHAADPLDIIFGDNSRGGVSCNDIFNSKELENYVASLPLEDSFENEDTKIAPVIFDDSIHNTKLPLLVDDEDLLLSFLNKVVELNLGGMAITVGFRLDNPVNQIGNTGWDILEMQRTGEDLITKRIKNMQLL